MDEEDHDHERTVPGYDEINFGDLPAALRSLQMFDDPFLQMQATNMGIVDSFLTKLEYDVLAAELEDEKDRSGVFFLNAQSQMWLFMAYEVLRTWRQRVRETRDALQNGSIGEKLKGLKTDNGFAHYGKLARAAQLERILVNPNAGRLMAEDLALTYILFAQLDFLRVSLAKHEVKGSQKSIAFAPGYGRIDMWSGSIGYELEVGRVSLGSLSRRNVADGIRSWLSREIPDEKAIQSFKNFMKAGQMNPFADERGATGE